MKLSEIKSHRSTVYFIFLHALAVVLAAQVIVVTLQNKQLRTRQQTASSAIKVGTKLQLGDLLPLRRGTKIADTSYLLLFVFGTHCQFCKKNLPAWEALYDSIQNPSISVVAISLDSAVATAKFIQENRMRMAIFVPKEPELFMRKNSLEIVPQTLLVGEGQTVKMVWAGPLADSTIHDICEEARRLMTGGK